VVDSLGPRGITDQCGQFFIGQAIDAYAAPARTRHPRPQPSIDVRHEALTCYLRTLVIAIRLTRRQRNLDWVQIVVRDSRQQMSNAIEPGLFLVVGVHHVPGAHLSVGSGEQTSFACE